MPVTSYVTHAETFKADGAVAAFRGVGFDGAQATVQGQKIVGLAHTAAADGADFTVDLSGIVIVEAGDAIAVGDGLMVDAQGRAIPATGLLTLAAGATPVTSSAANGAILEGGDPPEYLFGDAMSAASAAGEFIEVLMRR